MEGNTVLNLKQYKEEGSAIARFIVENKIENEIATLKKIRQSSEVKKIAINDCKTALKNLMLLENENLNINKIMGYEGIAAKSYFSSIFNEFEWKGRKPRIKTDYLNAILDIGYSMLFNYISIILLIYGFDIYKGFLHQQFYMRKSLVCDLIEPFRSIIDWQIKNSINLKQFTKDDFEVMRGKYMLKFQENKKYIKVFSQCINDNKDGIFMFIQSFYRSFIKEKDIKEYKKFNIGE